MDATIGRIVHYRLTAENAEQINRRRTSGGSIADRIKDEKWPIGAQAHIGNPASEGQYMPMIVTAFWRDEYGAGEHGINGQVFLDGNDTLWATSVRNGDGPGTWTWPPRT